MLNEANIRQTNIFKVDVTSITAALSCLELLYNRGIVLRQQ